MKFPTIQLKVFVTTLSKDLGKADEELIAMMARCTYKVEAPDMICCATAIGVHKLATCYHCVKSLIPTDLAKNELTRHREARITLTNAADVNKQITAKILTYSIEKDVVLLEALDGVKVAEDDTLILEEASLGQSYFILVGIFT